MPFRDRAFAWSLVLLVLGTWLFALVVDGGRTGGLGGDARPLDPASADAPVVVVGIAGLTWELIEEADPPHLTRVAQEGRSAALVLRGTHEVTCAPDAWLTLGAGQRAATDHDGCGDGIPGPGSPAAPFLAEDRVPEEDWARWQSAAQRRALGPELGSLAEGLRDQTCIASYGTDAALGAADAEGVVERYEARGLDGPPELVTDCRLHLVSAPSTLAGSGLAPADAVAAVDAWLGRWLEALPEEAVVVVAGLGHVADRPDAMALIVGGAGEGGLGSLSTRQDQLVQLTDLSVGVHQLLGEAPGPALAGGQLVTTTGGPSSAADLADGVSTAKALVPWTLGILGAVLLPVLLGATLLGRRELARRTATVALAVPVSAFLVGLAPWWTGGSPRLTLPLLILGIAVILAEAARLGPWRTHPLGPVAVVSALTLVVLGGDVILSSRLGMVSVLGLEPVTAGRFYGQGNVGFGIVLGAFVVLAAGLLSLLGDRRVEAAAAVGLVGGAAVLVNAAPQAGADFGGVPSLVVATGLLVLSALRIRWTPWSLALLALVGAVVAGSVMLADWLRGPESWTHLGGFVDSALRGEAWGVVTRKLEQSLGILINYPISWLAVLALAALGWVVFSRPRWSAPLWDITGVRPAAVAGVVTTALAWALNDSGIAAAALSLTVMVTSGWAVLHAPAAQPSDHGRPGIPSRRTGDRETEHQRGDS